MSDGVAFRIAMKLIDNVGDVFGIKRTLSDYPLVTTIPFMVEVARGKFPGMTVFEAFGERASIATTSTGDDTWRGAATTIPEPPAAGDLMSVVSSSVNDIDPNGSGARVINVHYLDENGDEQEVSANMNGQNTVDIPVIKMRFVQYIHVTSKGSNGAAVGNIIIHKTGDAATIYNTIIIGTNRSLRAQRMTPNNKTFLLLGWNCSSSAKSAQDPDLTARIRSTDDNGVLIPGVYNFKDSAITKNTAPNRDLINSPKIIPSLSVTKITTWTDVAGQNVEGGFYGVLIG